MEERYRWAFLRSMRFDERKSMRPEKMFSRSPSPLVLALVLVVDDVMGCSSVCCCCCCCLGCVVVKEDEDEEFDVDLMKSVGWAGRRVGV